MANCGGGALAGAVSQAGGLGFIAAGYNALKTLPGEIAIAKDMIKASPPKQIAQRDSSRNVQLPDRLPVGVGFITFLLAKLDRKAHSNGTQATSNGSEEDSPYPALQLVLDAKVAAIWFSFGDCKRYIDYVRWKSPNTKVFVQAVNVQEAITAATDWSADVVVLQGSESGGHGAREGHGITTTSFVPSAIKQLSANSATSKTLICAAGGVATGAQLASVLALGAHGAAIGTRFLLCPEALYSQQAKEALLRADDPLATIRTRVFDFARGNDDWPLMYDGRALRNKTTREESEINVANNHLSAKVWPAPEAQSSLGEVDDSLDTQVENTHQDSEGGGRALARLKRLYQDAIHKNDTDRLVVWASQSVALMTSVKPAGEILEEINREAVQRIKDLQGLLA